MAHIMAIALSPPHKVKELLKIYLSKDKPAYPDFLEKKNVYSIYSFIQTVPISISSLFHLR